MSERSEPADQSLKFPTWKTRFRDDCELRGKIPAYDTIGEAVLRLLWESGLEPTVDAVVKAVRYDAN